MGSGISSTARAHVGQRKGGSGRGHSYTDIVITDNARVHNGDVHNIRNFYGTWPDAVSCEVQQRATSNSIKVLGKRKRSTCDIGDEPCQSGNSFLAMAMSQLGEFSTSLQHQKQDAAAQRVVSCIRVIMNAIEASGTAFKGAHTNEELAKMQNGLLLTNRVGINSLEQRKIPEQAIKATRKSSLIILGHWKIALDTLVWFALDERAREVTGSFSALRLEPLNLTSMSPIAAFFGERADHLQTSVIHPTIFAYRYVSDHSEAFNVVILDDVTGLVKLLAEQKATTRDLDSEGRSLFHVSVLISVAITTQLTVPSMHANMRV